MPHIIEVLEIIDSGQRTGRWQLTLRSDGNKPIDRTYPLQELAAAHSYSETGRAVGKIAIAVSS